MPEMIDKAEALKHTDFDGDERFRIVHEWLLIAPAIEAEPVQHGRWIPTEYDSYADGAPVWDKWECSECGHEHSGEEDTLTAFCPDCCAKMDGKSTLGSEANGCWISCAECANTGCKNRYVQEAQEDE